MFQTLLSFVMNPKNVFPLLWLSTRMLHFTNWWSKVWVETIMHTQYLPVNMVEVDQMSIKN